MYQILKEKRPLKTPATIDVEPTDSFVITADVYIPNLDGCGTFPREWPGNMIHEAGIAALRAGDQKPVYIFGNLTRGTVDFRDKTWNNKSQPKHYVMQQVGLDQEVWWNQWMKLKIDYNRTKPGNVMASIYVPWQSPAGKGWIGLADVPCNKQAFTKIQLGGTQSWTSAQFDNVTFISGIPD